MSVAEIIKANVSQTEALLQEAQDRIASVLPAHIKVDRMINVALELVTGESKLSLCDPISILKGVMEASQLGLLLNKHLGHGYLVPFKNGELTNKYKTQMYSAEFLIGYRGFIDMVVRSNPAVTSIFSRLVYNGEHFELLEGTQHQLVHVPSVSARAFKEYLGAYAVVLFKDGTQPDFEWMPKEEIEKIHRFSKAQGPDSPWATWTEEMVKKTPLRRLCKRLKLSPEFISATVRDEYRELGYDGDKPQPRTIQMPRRMSDPPPEAPEGPQEGQQQATGAAGPPPAQQQAETGGDSSLPEEVKEFHRLIEVLQKADESITPESVVGRYFQTKNGKTPKFEEVGKFHTKKQLEWVANVNEKIKKEFSSIIPPDSENESQEPPQDDQKPSLFR